LLFRTSRGEPINADSLAKHFKAILKQACLPELRLYDLRHTESRLLSECRPRLYRSS